MYGPVCVLGKAPQNAICPVSRSPQTSLNCPLRDVNTKLSTPAAPGSMPPLVSPQQLTLPVSSSAQVNLSPAAMVETGMHTFMPSPSVPSGHAAPHTPFVHVRVAPE